MVDYGLGDSDGYVSDEAVEEDQYYVAIGGLYFENYEHAEKDHDVETYEACKSYFRGDILLLSWEGDESYELIDAERENDVYNNNS